MSATKRHEVAIHQEMGPQNQQKINQDLTTNAQPLNIVNNFQGRNRTTNYQQQGMILLFTQLYPPKKSILAFAQNVVKARVIIIVKKVQQKSKELQQLRNTWSVC